MTRRRSSPAVTRAAGGESPGAHSHGAQREPFTVVAIGASAGGLDAFQRLLDTLPPHGGMAFILVQHLDPTHPSLMVELLASHTRMTVRQAADSMQLEADCIYVIPPGSYLALHEGKLVVSSPRAGQGARLPFDFLLQSLAQEAGARAIAVVLSGTGADGSTGLKAVRQAGGFVVAQDPDDASHDGMPRSAIATGYVDIVLPVARIAEALRERASGLPSGRLGGGNPTPREPPPWLPRIIALLRDRAAHDFTLYKSGTLQRRIERRLAMAGIASGDHDRYLNLLRDDAKELDRLAKDLLINVTSFFRDPKVFDLLSERIIPELVRDHAGELPLRIWIAGCSTGEETYSLAMLLREQIDASGRNIKLQVFASDVDPGAVAAARDGVYPEAISTAVSPARLARFFTREGEGYRVRPELRSAVVFTVQDLLADPPFSKLDLISCRNLLIYLLPEAQEKVLSLFHFALREGGILVLGSAEAIADDDRRFAAIGKPERIFRHVGRNRPGELTFTQADGAGARMSGRTRQLEAPSHQAALAELCRRHVLERYAPAAVLVNRRNECVYSLGPTDRYLQVAPGHASNDIVAMARVGVRAKLRAALQRAARDDAQVTVTGSVASLPGGNPAFSLVVEPVRADGEDLLLICFVDGPKPAPVHDTPTGSRDVSRIAELERELEGTRAELESAVRSLEISSEAQRAIDDEARSVKEEYQATNEELLTSKEELQSLNEELKALNSQLQESLERQRTTSNDLQNILYSTNVATLFLDRALNIRFFTPATRALFSVMPGDVGRPLAHLSSLAADSQLLADARVVLQKLAPIEREIEAQTGAWYLRRILPYRAQDEDVEGVVITFADITERRRTADALEVAKREAQRANVAKSRFLAAASHDLRQPLQTLALLQGLLSKQVKGEPARNLLALLDQALGAMSGMLNTLLDINQIEAGTVHAEPTDFPIAEMLERLRREFTYHAQAKGLVLRVVGSSVVVRSDPLLLEQMMRNLLSNAMKYTKRGKVLLGCRRRGDRLSIEVWDTGIGIPAKELAAIFEEYHQVGHPARERSRGLGLGLAIVQRLGDLLGHRIRVRSNPTKGSAFTIDVPVSSAASASAIRNRRGEVPTAQQPRERRTGTILIVEDDPEIRDLLELLLAEEGHHAMTAPDAKTALDLVARHRIQPDLLLADYNLPAGTDGLQITARLRTMLRRSLPAIILTGDMSTATLRNIAAEGCVQLNKPVKAVELMDAIRRCLPLEPSAAHGASLETDAGTAPPPPVVLVVDDDAHVRDVIRRLLEARGWQVETFASAEAFLAHRRPRADACLLIDVSLPGMSGVELLRHLRATGERLPTVMVTHDSDIATAVSAMRAGAADFIEKPFMRADLIAAIERALEQARDGGKAVAWRADAADRIASLTARQRQIMEAVLAGESNKNIAADLKISRRTVENHRAEIMRRTGSSSLPGLARLALAAAEHAAHSPLDAGAGPRTDDGR